MVRATDFAALAKEDPPPIPIEGQLVEPPRDRVRFHAYGRDGPRMQDISRRNQHAEGGVGREEQPVITIEEAVGRAGYVGVKFDIPEVAILVPPVSLVTDGFQREVGPARFVQHVQEAERGEGDDDKDNAGEGRSSKFHTLGLQEATMGRFRTRDQRKVSEDRGSDANHKHHDPIMEEVKLLH